MNAKEQGDNGVGSAIEYFISQGYKVSLPITSDQRYDLIVDKDNILSRIECKTGTFKSEYNIPIVALKTCGGNKSGSSSKNISSKDCDLVFILVLPEKDRYLIPISLIDNQTQIYLGKKYIKNKI